MHWLLLIPYFGSTQGYGEYCRQYGFGPFNLARAACEYPGMDSCIEPLVWLHLRVILIYILLPQYTVTL